MHFDFSCTKFFVWNNTLFYLTQVLPSTGLYGWYSPLMVYMHSCIKTTNICFTSKYSLSYLCSYSKIDHSHWTITLGIPKPLLSQPLISRWRLKTKTSVPKSSGIMTSPHIHTSHCCWEDCLCWRTFFFLTQPFLSTEYIFFVQPERVKGLLHCAALAIFLI